MGDHEPGRRRAADRIFGLTYTWCPARARAPPRRAGHRAHRQPLPGGGGLSARFENVLAVDGAGSALRARNSGLAHGQYRNQRRRSTAHQWAAGCGKFGLSLGRVARQARKVRAGTAFNRAGREKREVFFFGGSGEEEWRVCARSTTSQSIVHGARASVSPLANVSASFPPWEPSMRGTWSVRARHPQRVPKKHAGFSSRLWAVSQPSCQRLTALTCSSHRVRACL